MPRPARRLVAHSLLALLLAAVAGAHPAVAAGRSFPLTRTSELLAPGERAVGTALTARLVRGTESGEQAYSALDVDARVLHGFVGSQLSLGLEATAVRFGVDATAIDGRLTGAWQWRLLPADGPVGLSLVTGAALALDAQAVELQLRAVLDRRWRRVAVAVDAGLTHRPQWSVGAPGELATWLEQSAAASYDVGDTGARTGVEVLGREGYGAKGFGGAALLVGPTFAVVRGGWRVSAGLYAQVTAFKPRARRQADEALGAAAERLEVEHNERFWLRLAVEAPVR